MTIRGVEREIARGRVVVDAPASQRRAGAAISFVGVVALPAAISLLEPRAIGAGALAVPGIALLASAALFFGGLAIAASAGGPVAPPRRPPTEPMPQRRYGKRSAGVLFESNGHLFVHTDDGSWTLPKNALRGAHYDSDSQLLIINANDDLRIGLTVRDEREARRISALLGVERRRAGLELTRETRVARVVEGCAAGVAGLFVSLLFMLAAVVMLDAMVAPPFGGLSMLALIGSGLFPVFMTIRYVSRFGAPLSVILGSEGMLVMARPEQLYLAYEDIDSIEVCDRGVIVRREDGSDHFIRTIEPEILASALSAQLHREPSARVRVPGLERGSAPMNVWRVRLAELAGRTDRYRIGYVDDERLAGIVEDPRAPLEERVGAAFVLAQRGDERILARVRSAAERSAHPILRDALMAAARGDIEEAAVEEARLAAAPRTTYGEHLAMR
ncbi:MAG: hypothetical protein HOW73_45270 [Polyangiaceae bacterium]|nr:hypothetical protein [Polyangiaceae bacterium]